MGVDVFFSSFICAKRKDILPLSTEGTKEPQERNNGTNIILMCNDGFHRTVTAFSHSHKFLTHHMQSMPNLPHALYTGALDTIDILRQQTLVDAYIARHLRDI